MAAQLLVRVASAELYSLSGWWSAQGDRSVGDIAELAAKSVERAGLVGGGLLVVANVLFVVAFLRLANWTANCCIAWGQRVEELLHPQLRILVNAEVSGSTPTRLWANSAQGLAAADTADRWIERAGSRRIASLVTELGATAIAVSGRRGMGKTTLLRHILGSVTTPAAEAQEPISGRRKQSAGTEHLLRKPISVFVEAPVDYAPRDFLLDLFAQLCEAVIAADGGQRYRARTQAGHVTLRVTRSIIRSLCLVVGLAYVVHSWGDRTNPAARLPLELSDLIVRAVGLNVAVSSGAKLVIACGFIGANIAARKIGRGGSGDLARRAIKELGQIHYLQTLQSERSLTASRWLVGTGWRRTRQLAQQPITVPELVRRYRNFAQTVAAKPPDKHGVGLLVAIDEMDRIASAQAAEGLLNQIKATFNVPGCIYLVTVSEEALAQFERRIATTRTAVDTSFDEVVWLPEFTVSESLALLRRRVTGFPDLFLVLCHCLAGGVPRDLVRAARSLVDARLSTGLDDLASLTRILIRAETASYVRGLLRDLRAQGRSATQQPTPSPGAISGVVPNNDGALVRLLVTAGSDSVALQTGVNMLVDQGDRQAAALEAVLAYYSLVEQLFTRHHDIANSVISEPPDADSLALIEAISAVRANLPDSPELAGEQIDELQSRLPPGKP
ncbi:hypothetical protein OG474_29355 [Kribbella sp. NBC_01505]|uniref:hypothetical protein n=1 Tax=Kribbella sp. NBC_01505 TaxID=2903580 RepID=UPI00386DD49F